MTNCPNCAAPVSGPVCVYCGTVFDQQAALNLAIGKKVNIKFEHRGREYEFSIILDEFRLDGEQGRDYGYADDSLYYAFSRPRYRVSINGEVVPSVMHGRESLICWRELPPDEVTA